MEITEKKRERERESYRPFHCFKIVSVRHWNITFIHLSIIRKLKQNMRECQMQADMEGTRFIS